MRDKKNQSCHKFLLEIRDFCLVCSLADILVKHGADINKRDSTGRNRWARVCLFSAALQFHFI